MQQPWVIIDNSEHTIAKLNAVNTHNYEMLFIGYLFNNQEDTYMDANHRWVNKFKHEGFNFGELKAQIAKLEKSLPTIREIEKTYQKLINKGVHFYSYQP